MWTLLTFKTEPWLPTWHVTRDMWHMRARWPTHLHTSTHHTEDTLFVKWQNQLCIGGHDTRMHRCPKTNDKDMSQTASTIASLFLLKVPPLVWRRGVHWPGGCWWRPLYNCRGGLGGAVSSSLSSASPVVLQKVTIRRLVITEKAPTRAFSWLKAATTAFTFKTLSRHYAKQTLTPR